MEILFYVAYFFGALFLVNAIPHLVSGLTGHPFQSPFAKPPGKGLSSSRTNVIWAWVNLVIGYLLVFHVGHFDLHNFVDAGVFGVGGLFASIFTASIFGPLHGGDLK